MLANENSPVGLHWETQPLSFTDSIKAFTVSSLRFCFQRLKVATILHYSNHFLPTRGCNSHVRERCKLVKRSHRKFGIIDLMHFMIPIPRKLTTTLSPWLHFSLAYPEKTRCWPSIEVQQKATPSLSQAPSSVPPHSTDCRTSDPSPSL